MRRLAAAIGTLIFLTACSEPPQKEIDRAQGAIDAARAAGADEYATEPFTAATTAMQQTHEAVQQRDYRLALSRAVDANERALEAAREAANGKAQAQSEAQAALARGLTATRLLADQLKAAEAARIPARELDPARRAHADAQRVLQEARKAMSAEHYLAVIRQSQDLLGKITPLITELTQAVETRGGKAKGRRR